MSGETCLEIVTSHATLELPRLDTMLKRLDTMERLFPVSRFLKGAWLSSQVMVHVELNYS